MTESVSTPIVEKGQRWRYDASNPFLIGKYTNWSYLTVEWVDGENVHYRKDHTPSKVDQTSIERFLETAKHVKTPIPEAPIDDFTLNLLYNHSIDVLVAGKQPAVSSVPLKEGEELEIGVRYLTRSGRVRKVVRELSLDLMKFHHGYQFVDDRGVYHIGNGAATIFDEETSDDFVARVITGSDHASNQKGTKEGPQ